MDEVDTAALQALYDQLRLDLISIDEQLAVRKQAAEQDADYREWRRHALRNKASKTVEIMQVKRRLRHLDREWRP